MEKSLKRVRRLAVIAVFAVIAVAAIGFAAGNTVEESGAGDGNEDISGYDITNITYDLEANPAYIDSVTFTATADAGAGPATQASVSFNGGVSWTTCTGGPVFTCDVAAASQSVLGASNLRVIAVQ